MAGDARRCALPGCEADIEDVPDRPPRRYCTAAHRAAARHARRNAVQPDSGSRLVAALPWLAEPVEAASPEPQVVPPAPEARLPAPRRRRTLAVLGAVGLLTGGFVITAAQPTPPASGTSTMPEPTTHDEWAARAQVTLASVQGQLEEIARAEVALNRLPEGRRSTIPVATQRLKERKALLERRKATLQSQLDSYRALDEARSELDKSEHDLESVEKAYGESAGRTSADDAELAALNEQRDLRIRQRDARRDELEVLEGNVANAARTPLPADGEETAEISDDVLAAVEHSGHNKVESDDEDDEPAPDTTLTLPEVVGGREQETPEREDTGISGPPDPRGPGDETKEQDAGARARKGPLEKIVDGVGDALRGAADTGPAAGLDDLPGKGGRDDAADGSGSRRSGGGLLGEVGDLLDGDADADRSDRGSGRDVDVSRTAVSRDDDSRDSSWGGDRDDRSHLDDADGSDRGGSDRDDSDRDDADRDDSDRDDAGWGSSGWGSSDRGGRDRDDADRDDSEPDDADSGDRSSYSRGSDGRSEAYELLRSLFDGSGDRDGNDHRDRDSDADEHEASSDDNDDNDDNDSSDDEHIERSNEERSDDGGGSWDGDDDRDHGSDEADRGDERWERGSDDHHSGDASDDDSPWQPEEDTDHWERSGSDHRDQDGHQDGHQDSDQDSDHRGGADDADAGDESDD